MIIFIFEIVLKVNYAKILSICDISPLQKIIDHSVLRFRKGLGKHSNISNVSDFEVYIHRIDLIDESFHLINVIGNILVFFCHYII